MSNIAGPRTMTNIAGKIRKTSGKRIFIGAFCARSSITCLLPRPHLDCLIPQDLADRDAEPVALHHRAHERADGGRVAAAQPVLERLERREAERLLLDRQPDLLAQRPVSRSDAIRSACVKRDARLERHYEQVDQRRQRRRRSSRSRCRARRCRKKFGPTQPTTKPDERRRPRSRRADAPPRPTSHIRRIGRTIAARAR